MALREIQTLTLAGVIKRGRKGCGIYRTFTTFYSLDKIAQNLVYRRKTEKSNYYPDELFFIFAIVFELIGIV